jgi:hypothetical protein
MVERAREVVDLVFVRADLQRSKLSGFEPLGAATKLCEAYEELPAECASDPGGDKEDEYLNGGIVQRRNRAVGDFDEDNSRDK